MQMDGIEKIGESPLDRIKFMNKKKHFFVVTFSIRKTPGNWKREMSQYQK